MILQDINPDGLEVVPGNVYTIRLNNKEKRTVRTNRYGIYYDLGKNFPIKILLTTEYTKSHILKDRFLYRDWREEQVFSLEYSEDVFKHHLFETKNAFIVCQILKEELSTVIQEKLVRYAKENQSVIILDGCDLLESESQKNKEITKEYIVRGKALKEDEVYKAVGLFFKDSGEIDDRFNVEEDLKFSRSPGSRIFIKYNPHIIEEHLKVDQKAYGMCGANDFDPEYEKQPTRCPVPLRYLDPPIARLVKLIGSFGLRTCYACVENKNLNVNSSKCGVLCFLYFNDLEKAFERITKFNSEILSFDKSYESGSWLGKKIIINRKDKEYIVDDILFWEIQRLCDFLVREA